MGERIMQLFTGAVIDGIRQHRDLSATESLSEDDVRLGATIIGKLIVKTIKGDDHEEKADE